MGAKRRETRRLRVTDWVLGSPTQGQDLHLDPGRLARIKRAIKTKKSARWSAKPKKPEK